MSDGINRDTTLGFRVREHEGEALRAAAALARVRLSEFLRMAALEKAQTVNRKGA